MTLPDFLPTLAGRAFPDDSLVSAMALAGGSYNQVFKISLAHGGDVVLRVAPPPAQQLHIEKYLMRNELAAAPFLAPIADLMPEVLFHDFSHELIDSDYIFMRYLPGIMAGDGLAAFADPLPFWADLGSVLARIHAVEGPGFGRIQGPQFDAWSANLINLFEQMQLDLFAVDLAANDLRTATMLLKRYASTVDAIDGPRLLHGDLFLGNVLINPAAASPLITGVLDSDRISWGDPASDWTFHLLRKRSATEKAAFWDGYGGPVRVSSGGMDSGGMDSGRTDSGTALRDTFYRICSLGESRLEFARRGLEEKAEATYPRMERELEKLFSLA